MRFHAIAVAALLLAAPCLATADDYPTPNGRYCGKLMSLGELVGAETVLKIDPNGRISGTYEFRDGNATTNGTLREVEKSASLTKTLRWTDKYGDGRLVITFDPAFMRFDGHWGTGDEVPGQTWFGQRCQAPIS